MLLLTNVVKNAFLIHTNDCFKVKYEKIEQQRFPLFFYKVITKFNYHSIADMISNGFVKLSTNLYQVAFKEIKLNLKFTWYYAELHLLKF
jgi:hypothetical protein